MLTLNQVSASLFDFERETYTEDDSPTDLQLLQSGQLRLQSQKFRLTSEAKTSLSKLIQCPSSFFSSLPNDVRANLTNRLLGDENRVGLEKVRVTIKNNTITGFSNAYLLHLSGTEVLETA